MTSDVMIHAIRPARLVAQPQAVDFGMLSARRTIRRPLTLVNAGGVEYLEQSYMCRSVYKQLGNIEKYMETRQGAGLDSIEDFAELSRRCDALLNTFAPVLIGGKWAFTPERPESVDKVFRPGG